MMHSIARVFTTPLKLCIPFVLLLISKMSQFQLFI